MHGDVTVVVVRFTGYTIEDVDSLAIRDAPGRASFNAACREPTESKNQRLCVDQ